MSNYYDLKCAECGEFAGFHWNHGQNQLVSIWEDRAWLVAFFELMSAKPKRDWAQDYDMDMKWGYLSESPGIYELASFAAKHNNCIVRPWSEYNEWFDQCGERIFCELCKQHYDKCTLKQEHTGEHVSEQPKGANE